MIRLKDCLLAACLLSPLTQAADLGTWGDLWPVREQDMLQLITQRLQSLQSSGQWDQTMDAFKQRVIENSQRPAPVEGIKRAEKYEQRWFDPSIRLTEDLKDNEGRVFARKGEVVNPLKTVPFVQTLYFINGDDADQLAWMKRQVPENPDEQNYPGAWQYPGHLRSAGQPDLFRPERCTEQAIWPDGGPGADHAGALR